MPDKRRPRAAAPMAAEDEVLLLQSQALAEEEAAKRKGEMLTRFLKDKLAKEERSSTLALHELRTRWRAVLREAKAKALRRDIEILSQTFARVMDCKDSVIESLVTDLEEAEEQHARALRSHLHNIDRLLQLQRCRLRCLEEGYGAQLQKDHPRAARARKPLPAGRGAGRGAGSRREQPRGHAEFPERPGMTSKTRACRRSSTAACSWRGRPRCSGSSSSGPCRATRRPPKHQKVAFEALKEKDEKSSREIEETGEKAAKAPGLGHSHQGPDRGSPPGERGAEPARVGGEGKGPSGGSRSSKSEMNQARAKAHGNLAQLTAQSNAALTALARVVEKVRLAAWGSIGGCPHPLLPCPSLALLPPGPARPAPGRAVPPAGVGGGEGAAVLPFLAGGGGEQRDARRVLQEPPAEPLARALGDYVGLERFWQRFNKAKLEELALARQRAAPEPEEPAPAGAAPGSTWGGSRCSTRPPPPSSLAGHPKSCSPRGPAPRWVHEVMRAPCTPTPTQTPSPAPPVPA
ncbi:unnamed protein product, partial [Bubo scandiacus]